MIINENLSDAYPYVRDLYESKPIYVQTEFLRVLNHFNDPDVY